MSPPRSFSQPRELRHHRRPAPAGVAEHVDPADAGGRRRRAWWRLASRWPELHRLPAAFSRPTGAGVGDVGRCGRTPTAPGGTKATPDDQHQPAKRGGRGRINVSSLARRISRQKVTRLYCVSVMKRTAITVVTLVAHFCTGGRRYGPNRRRSVRAAQTCNVSISGCTRPTGRSSGRSSRPTRTTPPT